MAHPRSIPRELEGRIMDRYLLGHSAQSIYDWVKAGNAHRAKPIETSRASIERCASGSRHRHAPAFPELQRATQDAQKAVEDLQTELQVEFEKRLRPILSDVAAAKNLHMVFSQSDSGVVWANPGLDITGDVIKKLDAAAGTAPKP